MRRRMFDLILIEVALISAAAVGVRIWANYRVVEGQPGLLLEVAKMAKVVTA